MKLLNKTGGFFVVTGCDRERGRMGDGERERNSVKLRETPCNSVVNKQLNNVLIYRWIT